MNFALLGDDLRALPFARAVIADRTHRLQCTIGAPACHAALRPNHPRLDVGASWEELLADKYLDAVIILGADDDVMRGARQLAATGKPLLLFPTPEQQSTFVYELTLIDAESPAVLFPLLPWRGRTLSRHLRDALNQQALGGLHHVRLERRILPEPPGVLLSNGVVAAAFFEYLDLLRYLGGDYDQVAASRIGPEQGGVSMATVTLGGRKLPQAVWSVAVGREAPAWQMTISGDCGTATLTTAGDDTRYALDIRASGEPISLATADDDWGAELLSRFEQQIAGKKVAPTWTDLTRSFDVLDGVERSVRRRRTIELYFETPSERSQFKSQMTAAGCSLLLLTLAGVVCFLMAASMFRFNETLLKVAVVLLFLPLGLFLGLQLLFFLTKPRAADDS